MEINQKRMLDTFQRLVSIDSPSFGERSICDFLKNEFSRFGITVIEDDAAEKIHGTAGNLYAYVPGTLPLEPILLCAHMDTVEPSRGKKAQIAEDGTITSDHTTVLGADDVSGITAILESLAVLLESGTPHRPYEILISAAEEPYCIGASVFDSSILHSKEAYVFDLSGPVGVAAIQAPTILSFRMTFTGRAAHAGFAPEEGIHAIHAASTALCGIVNGRICDCTVNVGTIQGGTANNIVPDSCSFTGEIRSYSDAQASHMLEYISEVCKTASTESGTVLTIESTHHCMAYRTDPSDPVAVRFQHACQTLGLSGELCQTFGGSDNNPLSEHGIHGVVLATAMNSCHTCEEYTSVSELERAARLALELILTQ